MDWRPPSRTTDGPERPTFDKRPDTLLANPPAQRPVRGHLAHAPEATRGTLPTADAVRSQTRTSLLSDPLGQRRNREHQGRLRHEWPADGPPGAPPTTRPHTEPGPARPAGAAGGHIKVPTCGAPARTGLSPRLAGGPTPPRRLPS